MDIGYSVLDIGNSDSFISIISTRLKFKMNRRKEQYESEII